MWRPEDWDNPHALYSLPNNDYQKQSTRLYHAYEAGATAGMNAEKIRAAKERNATSRLKRAT